jgi:hypothetical protein
MMVVVAPTVTEEGLPEVVERVSGLHLPDRAARSIRPVHENPVGAPPAGLSDRRSSRRLLRPVPLPRRRRVDRRDRARAQARRAQVIRYLLVRYDEMTEHEERPPRGQAASDGAPGGPFRRSQPGAAPAEATPEGEAPTETPAASADPLPAQAAPVETAESPAPSEAEEAAVPEDETPAAEAEPVGDAEEAEKE